MITSTHAIIYTDNAEADRAFFRDVLGFPSIDGGGGWLLFRLPPAELGIHPSGPPGQPGGGHEVYLMCDDVEATVAELTAKGVEFTGPPTEAGYGRTVTLRLPGGGDLSLYQPHHPTAYGLNG